MCHNRKEKIDHPETLFLLAGSNQQWNEWLMYANVWIKEGNKFLPRYHIYPSDVKFLSFFFRSKTTGPRVN